MLSKDKKDPDVVLIILKKKIEEKFGEKVCYSRQCEALSEAIFETIGERLSLVTLKRFFGFTTAQVEPRLFTLDILSRYCGYDTFEIAESEIMKSGLISEFRNVERIESSELDPGSVVIVEYKPERILRFRHLDGSLYLVEESINSKLKKGDTVKVDSFTQGFELIASQVLRDGNDLGAYIYAKQGGIQSLQVVDTV